jgi:endo-1,4-beta-xylanase
MIKNLLAVTCVLILVSCHQTKQLQSENQFNAQQAKGLKDYYEKYFSIGVAVSPQSLRNPEQQKLILEQFNSMTPENAMKMGPIHPRENEYNWRDADSIAAFAQRHKLKLRGHTLCWHSQAPAWIFVDAEGQGCEQRSFVTKIERSYLYCS